jgi:hypothetical protein
VVVVEEELSEPPSSPLDPSVELEVSGVVVVTVEVESGPPSELEVPPSWPSVVCAT